MNSQPNPMLDALTQLSADRPELRPLLEALRAQQFTHAEVVEDDDDEPAEADGPTRDELLLQNEQLIDLLKRARHEIKRLDARLGALRREAQEAGCFQAALAAALGACPECWGDDRACPSCRGRGTPGAYPADRPLYARYVLPAARRQAAGPPPAAGARPPATATTP